MGRNRSRRREGFTLIEVLVVVSMIGLIAVSIAAAFAVIVRTNPTNRDQVDDSRALLNLTRWLPGDVASAEPDKVWFKFDGSLPGRTDTAAAVCAAPAGSTPLLSLEWAEDLGTAVAFHVDYRWVPSSSEAGTIKRLSCNPAAPSTVRELRMSDELTALPGGVIPVSVSVDAVDSASNSVVLSALKSDTEVGVLYGPSATHTIVGVRFDVDVYDEDLGAPRDILRLDASPKNVEGEPLTSGPGSPTGVPPENDPPLALDLTLGVAVDDVDLVVNDGVSTVFVLPVSDFDGADTQLLTTLTSLTAPDGTSIAAGSPTATTDADFGGDDVGVYSVGDWTVTIANSPPRIKIETPDFDDPPPGPPGYDGTNPAQLGAFTYQLEYLVADRLGGTGSEATTGLVKLVLWDAGLTPDPPSTDFPAPPAVPCVASITSVEPAAVELKKNGDAGDLASNLTINITRNEYCNPLKIVFDTDGEGGLDETVEVKNSDKVTISGNSKNYTWRAPTSPTTYTFHLQEQLVGDPAPTLSTGSVDVYQRGDLP